MFYAKLVPVHHSELIIRSHLNGSNQHRSIDKGSGTTPESRRSFFSKDPEECIEDTFVIPPCIFRHRGVIGESHKRDFSRTTDQSCHHTRGHTHEHAGHEVGGSVLRHLVAKHLKESESRGSVEDLSEHSRAQPVVQTEKASFPNGLGEESGEGGRGQSRSRRGGRGDGEEVHPHGGGVEGVHHAPAGHPAQTRRDEVHVRGRGLGLVHPTTIGKLARLAGLLGEDVHGRS